MKNIRSLSKERNKQKKFSFARVNDNIKLLLSFLQDDEMMNYIITIYEKFERERDVIASSLDV